MFEENRKNVEDIKDMFRHNQQLTAKIGEVLERAVDYPTAKRQTQMLRIYQNGNVVQAICGQEPHTTRNASERQ